MAADACKRAMKFTYDTGMTFVQVLFSYEHTMLPMVLSKPLFWFLFFGELGCVLHT